MDLEQQLRMDVDAHLRSAFGDEYGGHFPQSFIVAVIEDVKLSSAYDDGHYSDTDIRWSLTRTVLELLERAPDAPNRRRDCLSCANSFSLHAGEPFDDGTISDEDCLICMISRGIVAENHICDYYNS